MAATRIAKRKARLTKGERLIREALTSQGRPLPGTPEHAAWIRGRDYGLEKASRLSPPAPGTSEDKAVQSAHLRAVTADTAPRRIEFTSQGRSTLGGLLGVVSALPALRYDPKRLRHVIDDCDAEAKGDLEEGLAETARAVVRTIRQIGMLVSSIDETSGSVGDTGGGTQGELVDLGFTIDGLADLAEQLLQARAEIADADAAEPATAAA